MPTPVIAIFDIGKTNKKLFLFDEGHRIVFEQSENIADTHDEDGHPCEDIHAITRWVLLKLEAVVKNQAYTLVAVNFSAHGAGFVLLDGDDKIAAPLYDYLKPFPASLREKFDLDYDVKKVCVETASPDLGNLNSGLQLYALKYGKPELFKKIKTALHLPEYFSWLITGVKRSTLPSIGCHTLLWDFQKSDYHAWVKSEGLDHLLAPIADCRTSVTVAIHGRPVAVGTGLHDSSAALIPYFSKIKEPFVLISTGTWSISLNPFNASPLTRAELDQDCLCYLSYAGKAVKASRYLIGPEHDRQSKRIAEHFASGADYFKALSFDAQFSGPAIDFPSADLSQFPSVAQAYHALMQYLIMKQVASTRLVLTNSASVKMYVDGGFSTNAIYMNLLRLQFDKHEVSSTSLVQASAMGAAMAAHSW